MNGIAPLCRRSWRLAPWLLLIAHGATGSSQSPAAPPRPAQPMSAWRVEAVAVGPIRIGMTEAEVRGAVTTSDVTVTAITRTLEGMPAPALAITARGSAKRTQRLLAEMEEGRVWRMEVTDPRLATSVGARVGLSLRRLEQIYGRGEIMMGEGRVYVRFSKRAPTHTYGLEGGPNLERAASSWKRLVRANPRVGQILVYSET